MGAHATRFRDLCHPELLTTGNDLEFSPRSAIPDGNLYFRTLADEVKSPHTAKNRCRPRVGKCAGCLSPRPAALPAQVPSGHLFGGPPSKDRAFFAFDMPDVGGSNLKKK